MKRILPILGFYIFLFGGTHNFKLRPEVVIRDFGKGYRLLLPWNLKTDAEGNIYVLNGNRMGRFYELLKFSANGKFIKKIAKKGQGPGEATDIANYLIKDGKIYIHDSGNSKIMIKDLKGALQEEFRVFYNGGETLKSIEDGVYYFSVSGACPIVRTEVKNCPIRFSRWSKKGGWKKGNTVFARRVYHIVGENGEIGRITMGEFIGECKGKYTFINDTAEYLIKVYDMEEDRIVRKITRKYERVKSKKGEEREEGGVMLGSKWYYAPPRKYRDDIQKILIEGEKLWIFTSRTDPGKGILVDEFTTQGGYIRNLWLHFFYKVNYRRLKYVPMAMAKDYLYTVEEDEEGNPLIVKYRLLPRSGQLGKKMRLHPEER